METEQLAVCICLSRWASCGSSDARRFRFDYLFNFLVLLETLFFRIPSLLAACKRVSPLAKQIMLTFKIMQALRGRWWPDQTLFTG